MGRTPSPSRGPSPTPAFLVLLALAAGAAWAQDLTFSAEVDKTSVKVGEPIHLTITLSGDISGIEVPTFEFPPEFAVAARSQSSQFSFRGGVAVRSVSLTYVLVPQQAGTFQLGPFQVERRGKVVPTEPITVSVEKPALPPNLPSGGGRVTL